MLKFTVFAGFGLVALTGQAQALINYGNFSAANVQFQNVTEDSLTDPGALYGTPVISADSLQFNPVSFGSTSMNSGTDVTNGTLTFTIQANPGRVIPTLVIQESGDYTLFGTGTALTSARVFAPVSIRVLEVNGLPIAPQTLNGNLTFSPTGGLFTLPGSAGVALPWGGIGTFDISSFLAGLGFSGDATKVDISMDNQLTTTSEAGTIAFIKKKDIGGTAIAVVPTPGALALLGLGGLMASRRRR